MINPASEISASESLFKIALLQLKTGSTQGTTVEHHVAHIRRAAAQGAQIVFLQELFASPYFCTVENHDFFALAEPVDGPLVTGMQQLARELSIVLVVPFYEKRAPGIYHNSAAVLDADGSVLGVYRKMHIPDDPLYYEKFYFTPGDASPGFQVFQTKYAKVGVLICWDQWYPEAARITSLLGAEVLFFPTAIGWHPQEKNEFGVAQTDAWITAQRAHAIANGVFVAAANRVGLEHTPGTAGIEFFGNSFVVDPFGRFLARATSDTEQVLMATCERSLIETTRQHWPFLRDRRVDAYLPITARYLEKP